MQPDEEFRRTWAYDQLSDAAIPQPVSTAVKRLLDVWWTMNHTPQTRDLTLDSFSKLACGHALVVEESPDEVWQAAKPGQLVIRDQVRVKYDAYQQEAGQAHNGRRGVVVAIRYGDVIVDYRDGKQPAFQGVHHSPHVLEKKLQ